MSEFATGKLLVASPSMVDPMFGRSVCLVMHHDEDGAIGVLLNRPLQPGPQELWKLLDSQESRVARPTNNRSVHFGGPMAGPVVALHAQQQLAEAETVAGVYVAAQKEHLQELVARGARGESAPMRLIIGHAAWQTGQLENEIAAGAWYLLPATAERVFEADDSMWPHLVRTGVGHTLASWVGIDDTHLDPSLN